MRLQRFSAGSQVSFDVIRRATRILGHELLPIPIKVLSLLPALALVFKESCFCSTDHLIEVAGFHRLHLENRDQADSVLLPCTYLWKKSGHRLSGIGDTKTALAYLTYHRVQKEPAVFTFYTIVVRGADKTCGNSLWYLLTVCETRSKAPFLYRVP